MASYLNTDEENYNYQYLTPEQAITLAIIGSANKILAGRKKKKEEAEEKAKEQIAEQEKKKQQQQEKKQKEKELFLQYPKEYFLWENFYGEKPTETKITPSFDVRTGKLLPTPPESPYEKIPPPIPGYPIPSEYTQPRLKTEAMAEEWSKIIEGTPTPQEEVKNKKAQIESTTIDYLIKGGDIENIPEGIRTLLGWEEKTPPDVYNEIKALASINALDKLSKGEDLDDIDKIALNMPVKVPPTEHELTMQKLDEQYKQWQIVNERRKATGVEGTEKGKGVGKGEESSVDTMKKFVDIYSKSLTSRTGAENAKNTFKTNIDIYNKQHGADYVPIFEVVAVDEEGNVIPGSKITKDNKGNAIVINEKGKVIKKAKPRESNKLVDIIDRKTEQSVFSSKTIKSTTKEKTPNTEALKKLKAISP